LYAPPPYDARLAAEDRVKGRSFGVWLLDLACGLAAYTGARAIWAEYGPFERLHLQLLTFAVALGMLRLVARGLRRAPRT
jgi:hypothetical protein